MHVSLFVTCLTDTFYPRVGEAMVRVLEHLGCSVDFPPAQTCCGQPMYNSGCHVEAAGLARRMVDLFEGDNPIVTPSGSCCAMVHDYYPSLLGADPVYGPRGRSLVSRTHEFVEFLLNVLKVDLRSLGCRWPRPEPEGGAVQVAYHYSCHLRGLGMRDEALTLLKQVQGMEMVDLPKADQCCGFGGAFAVKYADISTAMVRDKTDCIARSGASVLVSNDAGCTMNIAGACHRQGMKVRIKHIAEILAEGLGLMEVEGPGARVGEART